MKKIPFLFLSFISISSHARIPEGKMTNDFPEVVQMVKIQKSNQSEELEVTPLCTATLLNSKTLLTAAHCFADLKEPDTNPNLNRNPLSYGVILDEAHTIIPIQKFLYSIDRDLFIQNKTLQNDYKKTAIDLAIAELSSPYPIPIPLFPSIISAQTFSQPVETPFTVIGYGLDLMMMNSGFELFFDRKSESQWTLPLKTGEKINSPFPVKKQGFSKMISSPYFDKIINNTDDTDDNFLQNKNSRYFYTTQAFEKGERDQDHFLTKLVLKNKENKDSLSVAPGDSGSGVFLMTSLNKEPHPFYIQPKVLIGITTQTFSRVFPVKENEKDTFYTISLFYDLSSPIAHVFLKEAREAGFHF